MKKLLYILFVLLFLSLPVFSAEYYVKNGGNDSLDGLSDGNAWETVAKVTAIVSSGDTIYFRSQDTWVSATPPLIIVVEGVTYDGSTYGSGTRATLQATGDSLFSMVTIEESDVTFEGFEIDGNQKNTGGVYVGYKNISAIDNITVENCIVHDQGQPTGNTSKHWLYGILVGALSNSAVVNTDINIINCELYNSYHEGIAIYPSWGTTENVGNGVSDVLVSGCKIYNTGTDDNGANKSGSGFGIAVNNNSDNVTIRYCEIYNTGAITPGQVNGISFRDSPDGPKNGMQNNTIVEYNIIYGNTSSGILFQSNYGQDQTGAFFGNLIYNNAGYGIQIATADWGSSELNFYNNTILLSANGTDTFTGCFGLSRDSSSITGTPIFTLKNNILNTVTTSTSATDYLPLYADYGTGTFIHTNNLYYRSTGTAYTYVSIGNWGSHTYYYGVGEVADVTTWEATAQITTPTFAGGTLPTGFSGTYGTDMVPNQTYFSISSGDAVDNGATLGSPYNGCINGAGLTNPILRPQGSAYDIGAYEYDPSTESISMKAGTTGAIKSGNAGSFGN